MREKLRFDISNENLDNYFANKMIGLPDEYKERIPRNINVKLWKTNGRFNLNSLNRLPLLERLFILQRSLNKNIYIIIEDEKGLTEADFLKWKEGLKKKEESILFAETLNVQGHFFLADKDLAKTFAYLNQLSISSAYNYVSKVKNIPQNKVQEFRKKTQYIANFLSNYDGQKKKIVVEQNITIPEFYTLLCLYEGKPVLASSIYREKFKYAFNSSRTQIQKSFVTLQQQKFIEKIGKNKGAKFKITAAGMSFVDDLMYKYFINF